ncbi:hypothetical protein QFC20_003567 [Naganishia adeliensis]|uniref:Uncharacterized protein n=1 Tax=Naganishia adeliensis TaxID=92952 RepID=A0ACC2W8Z1_9TREE|nr:hypothetical protein QFC20_003567 [Naganishia adeliensis]
MTEHASIPDMAQRLPGFGPVQLFPVSSETDDYLAHGRYDYRQIDSLTDRITNPLLDDLGIQRLPHLRTGSSQLIYQTVRLGYVADVGTDARLFEWHDEGMISGRAVQQIKAWNAVLVLRLEDKLAQREQTIRQQEFGNWKKNSLASRADLSHALGALGAQLGSLAAADDARKEAERINEETIAILRQDLDRMVAEREEARRRVTDLEEQACLTAVEVNESRKQVSGTVGLLAFSIATLYSTMTPIVADLDDKKRRIDLLHQIVTNAKEDIRRLGRD